MVCSLPGSSNHRLFQARILEWVSTSFSRESSQPRYQTLVSHVADQLFTIWATREAQSDSRRGTTARKSKPIPTRWATHKLEKIIPQKLSHRSESAEPYIRLCSVGVWQQEEESPENPALEASRVWLQDFHTTGGNRNSILGGYTQSLSHTRTQEKKKQWPQKRPGQTCLLVAQGLWCRWGGGWLSLTAGTETLATAVLGSSHWFAPSH